MTGARIGNRTIFPGNLWNHACRRFASVEVFFNNGEKAYNDYRPPFSAAVSRAEERM